MAEASAQLWEDFAAGVAVHGIDPEREQNGYWFFCLGVVMSAMTYRTMNENPDLWFDPSSLEKSAEAYFTAANKRVQHQVPIASGICWLTTTASPDSDAN